MRLIKPIAFLLLASLVVACTGHRKKLTLTAYVPGSDSYNAAVAIKDVLSDDGWELTIVSNTHEEGLELVRNGTIDLAITSNDVSLNAKGLRSLIPLYNEVHISLVDEDSPLLGAENLDEILKITETNRIKVLFSEKGSYSHKFSQRLLNDIGITDTMYEAIYFPLSAEYDSGKISLVKLEDPDLINIVGNVDNDIIGEIMDLGYDFRNKDNNIDNIDGSYLSSFPLKMARSFPVIIPAYTISRKQSEAMVAAGLYTSLISNKNLDDELVYDLVSDIIRAQPELIQYNANFFEMSEDFDHRFLNFQVHVGALNYYERDEPSFFERYAELAGVIFSMFVVLMTFLFTLSRIFKQRKKDRIDVYYLEVLEIRKNENYKQAIEQLLALETKAFEQLVDEKLAADSSFVVFMQQLSQARLEISDKVK